MKRLVPIIILFGVAMAISILTAPPRAVASDVTIVSHVYDLTKGFQIPIAGDTPTTGPQSTPGTSPAAIVLGATAAYATAYAYSPIIDLAGSFPDEPTKIAGPAKGLGGMDIQGFTGSGTVTVTCVALYGVDRSNVTTVSDQSGTSNSYTGTMTFGGSLNTDTTHMKAFSNHVPRNARFCRFMLHNTSGVAATIPASGWQYFSP